MHGYHAPLEIALPIIAHHWALVRPVKDGALTDDDRQLPARG